MLECNLGGESAPAAAVPKMLRVISRPMTVPAERIALLNAGLAIIFSNMPGSAVSRDFTSPSALGSPVCSTGGGNGASAGGGASLRVAAVS